MLLTLKRWVLRLLDLWGVDPLRLMAVRHLPKYLADRRRFTGAGGVISRDHPVVADFYGQAGCAAGHYFHQDLLVAQCVYRANPLRHLDVGSRIDGFVAHVASFRKIEVLDARPLKESGHPNISFTRLDLSVSGAGLEEVADSVSCLHALEHFGLGRYGDEIDPAGHVKGFNTLCRMLTQGGTLYLSVPIGGENQVVFNAHRVFEPREMLRLAEGRLRLEAFHLVDDRGELHRDWPLLEKLPEVRYGCGIYVFGKSKSPLSPL